MEQKARIVDVAHRAGVARATAGRALSGDPNLRISPETRERIQAAARQMGYVSNAHARNLKNRKSSLLGVLSGNLSGSYESRAFSKVNQGIGAMGHEALLGITVENLDAAMRYADTFRSYNTFGVMILDQHGVPNPDLIQKLRASRNECGPCFSMSFQGRPQGIASITVDMEWVYRQCMHLFHLDGRRSVIICSRRSPGFANMIPTIRTVMREYADVAGGAFELDVPSAQDMGREMVPLIQQHLSSGPVGVFVGVDTDGAYLARALIQAGISIPDQVAIIGHGNFEIGRFSEPQLSSFDMFNIVGSMTDKAMELIEQMDRGEDLEPVEHCYRPELIVRESFVPKGSLI